MLEWRRLWRDRSGEGAFDDGRQAPFAAACGVVHGHAEEFLAYGKTDANRNYEVNSWNEGQLPIGVYRVLIAPPPMPARRQRPRRSIFDHPEMEVMKMGFPKKYRDTSTSGLGMRSRWSRT